MDKAAKPAVWERRSGSGCREAFQGEWSAGRVPLLGTVASCHPWLLVGTAECQGGLHLCPQCLVFVTCLALHRVGEMVRLVARRLAHKGRPSSSEPRVKSFSHPTIFVHQV